MVSVCTEAFLEPSCEAPTYQTNDDEAGLAKDHVRSRGRPEKELAISRKVFAGNLSFDLTREDVQELFGSVGTVSDIVLPLDRVSGRPRGFAFVEYESEEGAASAIEKLNGKELGGRAIRVEEARERPPRPPRSPSSPAPFDPNGRPFKRKGSRRNIRGRKRGFF